MGQYYKPINLDKEEWLYSHDYDNGLKLMEHSYVRNSFVETVGILLLKDYPWYKTRIIWAGDYTEQEDFPMPEEYDSKALALAEKYIQEAKDNPQAYYYDKTIEDIEININDYADEYFTKITPNDAEKKGRLTLKNIVRYYFNDTKKEYFDISKVVSVHGTRVHPLPLLTCTCNHSGGSYYGYEGETKEQQALIGSWKGDVIFSAYHLSEVGNIDEYKLIKPLFKEE